MKTTPWLRTPCFFFIFLSPAYRIWKCNGVRNRCYFLVPIARMSESNNFFLKNCSFIQHSRGRSHKSTLFVKQLAEGITRRCANSARETYSFCTSLPHLWTTWTNSVLLLAGWSSVSYPTIGFSGQRAESNFWIFIYSQNKVFLPTHASGCCFLIRGDVPRTDAVTCPPPTVNCFEV